MKKNIMFKSLVMAAIVAGSSLSTANAVNDGQKFKDWKGKCEKLDGKKFCGVTQTVFDKDKKPIINIFIRKMKKQKTTMAFIKVPLGVNLQAGLGVAVDNKEVAKIPYTVCDPAGCNALLPMNSELLKVIKKGKKMQIGMFLLNEQIIMPASLSGISKAIKSL